MAKVELIVRTAGNNVEYVSAGVVRSGFVVKKYTTLSKLSQKDDSFELCQ